jgi:hypothetical protein
MDAHFRQNIGPLLFDPSFVEEEALSFGFEIAELL